MNSQADVRTFTQSAGLFPPVSNHSGEFPEFSQMIQILFNQLENIEKQFKSGTAASGQLYGSLMMMMSEFSEHRSSINPERSDARRLVNSLRDLIIKSGSSLTAAELRVLTGKFNVLIENLTKDTAVSPECFQIDGEEGGTAAPKDDQAEAKPDLYSDYIQKEEQKNRKIISQKIEGSLLKSFIIPIFKRYGTNMYRKDCRPEQKKPAANDSAASPLLKKAAAFIRARRALLTVLAVILLTGGFVIYLLKYDHEMLQNLLPEGLYRALFIEKQIELWDDSMFSDENEGSGETGETQR